MNTTSDLRSDDAPRPWIPADVRARVARVVGEEIRRVLAAGHDATIEDYIRQAPFLGQDEVLLFECICEEREARRRVDRDFGLQHYQERFPRAAALLAITQELAESLDPPEEPESDQSPLPDVPGYEIVELLGSGSMGTVYKAKHVSMGGAWEALKLLYPQASCRAEGRTHFLREVSTLGKLRSKQNIVQCYQAGETGGRLYYSMELCGKGTLAERIARFTPVEAARLVLKLANALHEAHQNGILHRDLKPANILFDEKNEPKIADFGLALWVKSEGAGRQTTGGGLAGTPAYMAPEQFDPALAIGVAADVYALGTILYELLARHLPFEGDFGTIQAYKMERTGPTRSPRDRNGSVPRDLDAIVRKCLQRDTSSRYGGADALAADLARYLEGRPVKARPVSPPEEAWYWACREPLPAFLLFLVVVGGAVGGWLVWVEYIRAEQHAAAALLALHNEREARAAEKRAKGEAEVARDRALGEARRARAVADALTGRDDNPFGLQSPLRQMPPGRGETLPFSEVLARGKAFASLQFKQTPELQAAALEAVGNGYRELGLFAPAKENLEEALRLRQEAERASPKSASARRDFAASLASLGTLFHARGWPTHEDHANARTHYRDALRIWRGIGEEEGEGAREVALLDAWLSMETEQYEEARNLFAQLAERTKGAGGAERWQTQVRLGMLSAEAEVAFARVGFSPAALWPLVRLAWEVSRAEANPTWQSALNRFSAGWAFHLAGVTANRFTPGLLGHACHWWAEAEYRDCVKVITPRGDHNTLAVARFFLAESLAARGDTKAAVVEYEAAFAQLARADGPEHPKAPLVVGRYARALARLGRADEATALFTRLETAVSDRFTPRHWRLANTLVAYSDFLLERGEWAAAERKSTQALEIFKGANGSKHALYKRCEENLRKAKARLWLP